MDAAPKRSVVLTLLWLGHTTCAQAGPAAEAGPQIVLLEQAPPAGGKAPEANATVAQAGSKTLKYIDERVAKVHEARMEGRTIQDEAFEPDAFQLRHPSIAESWILQEVTNSAELRGLAVAKDILNKLPAERRVRYYSVDYEKVNKDLVDWIVVRSKKSAEGSVKKRPDAMGTSWMQGDIDSDGSGPKKTMPFTVKEFDKIIDLLDPERRSGKLYKPSLEADAKKVDDEERQLLKEYGHKPTLDAYEKAMRMHAEDEKSGKFKGKRT